MRLTAISRSRSVAFVNLAFFILTLTACHRHAHTAAQHHMHRQNFDELVKHFEDPARDAWQKPQAVLSLIAAHLKQQKVKSPIVADLGAGTGYFSFRLLDAGYNVTADGKTLPYQTIIFATPEK
jgi:23S rRNA C2498 (ribose-2'-O)-methylase RlmM